MFNIAQGFKDIANKFKSGLPIKNGGTGATDRATALNNLINFTPSNIQLVRSYGSNTSISTSYNYFIPSFGGSSYWTTQYQKGYLSSVSQSVTWQNRTQTVTGIKVDENISGGNTGLFGSVYILISGNVRYLKNTSTNSSLQTGIIRLRNETYETVNWVTGTYGAERLSQSFCQLVLAYPGDFFFLGGYKGTASHDVDIIDGVSTKWGAVLVNSFMTEAITV